METQPTEEAVDTTEISETEVPEKWKKLPLADMIDKGWRPRIKEVGERAYITMRFGTQERGLGPFTEERWDLLMELHPKLRAIMSRKQLPPSKGSLLKVKISKPNPLKTSATISVQTLAWYEWAQTRGYPGSLGDFLNELVQDYFRKEGLSVVIVREANVNGN